MQQQNCYSGSFAFSDEDDGGHPAPQHHRSSGAAATAAAGAAAEPAPASAAPPPSPLPQQPGGPPPMLYIKSDRLAQLSAGLPVNQDRSRLVHSLVEAYGLLQGATVAEAQPASVPQLLSFHSRDYLQALALWPQLSEHRRAEYGLADDCAPFPGLFELAALTAGGSLAAAAGLCSGQHQIAVNLDGGRHHAHKSKASGFCYVNDVVLAVLQLLGSFRRVLYLDIDVHHGDAVEDAFFYTPRVLTVSFHKHAPGFFPGTGGGGSGGGGAGHAHALNLPLGDGLWDELFVAAFAELAGGAVAAYDPDCVVMQCGTDGLARDPVAGAWALTPAAYAAVASKAAGWRRPLLVLGGGGYHSVSAAVTWAGVVAAALGRELADDIPEHDDLGCYGPGFSRSSATKRLLPPDTNDASAVLAACRGMVEDLRATLGATGTAGGGSRAGCSSGGNRGGPAQLPPGKRTKAQA